MGLVTGEEVKSIELVDLLQAMAADSVLDSFSFVLAPFAGLQIDIVVVAAATCGAGVE